MNLSSDSQFRSRFIGTALAVGSVFALFTGACAQSSNQHQRAVTHADADAMSTTDQPGTHHITAADLPVPFATPSVNNGQDIVPRPADVSLHTLPGFKVSEWSAGLVNPRWIQVAPNGDVFVSESSAGRIAVLRPNPNGGKPTITRFVTGLSQPFGIAFYPLGPNPQYVYIADTDEVLRFPYKNGQTTSSVTVDQATKIEALTPGGYNQHWTRTIVFSPDSKKLYIGVGSRENIGEEDPPRACVMTCNPDGSDFKPYATGLRNAVGLTFNPVNGALWAATNERDGLGSHVPPDYTTSVKPDGFYGWPYTYIGAHHDPRMPNKPDLESKAIVPDVLLEPHCAALSIEFDTGHQFPAQFHDDGFVAMHGSWNRADPSGYKVVRIPMNPDGTAKGTYQDFVWGWKLHPNGPVWGRPVSATFMKDGSLLISDDGGNVIWRVTHTNQGKA